MKFTELSLWGAYKIEPQVFTDERGFFFEQYSEDKFKDAGISASFVQDNHSCSHKGVLRGLHFQNPPFAQDKLVYASRGTIYDVIVDIREGSDTYGQWEGIELSDENHLMLYVPKGFAHGFCVLSDVAVFQYKVSNYYAPDHEGGLMWDDPDLAIEWPVDDPIVADKDAHYPAFEKFESRFNI